MTDIKTVVQKSSDGWRAESALEFGENKELRINTRKDPRGGICTNATVHTVTSEGYLQHFLYQDFSSRRMTWPMVRCTEKSVREQHSAVLAQINVILKDVENHYGRVGK